MIANEQHRRIVGNVFFTDNFDLPKEHLGGKPQQPNDETICHGKIVAHVGVEPVAKIVSNCSFVGLGNPTSDESHCERRRQSLDEARLHRHPQLKH